MATARTKTGLSVKTFSGLSKKRMASKGGGANAGNRIVMKDGDTIPVQFWNDPSGFTEFEIHQFQEDGRWQNVPCLGDGCPLCDDESDAKSKTKYRFAVAAYNVKDKKSQILEGPKDLAQKIFFRYEQKPNLFLKRPWEITRFPTNPTSYACDKGEVEELVKISGVKPLDVMDYITNEAKAYYGDDMPTASSLDVDDDDDEAEEDEDTWDRKELSKKSLAALKKIAKDEGVSAADIKGAGTDKDALIGLILGDEDDADDDDADEDEDDLDDDLDDDEDDDEDEEYEEEDDDEDGLDDMSLAELRKYAKTTAGGSHAAADVRGLDKDALIALIRGDDEDDEDDDDEDEDDLDDDEDDDEDDEPTPPKKSARKAPAKKARR